MKKYFSICFLLLTVGFVVNAQQITLEFQNPTITNDGVDDFYEVDVYISSDVSYSQGIGGFLFNYNVLAFGPNIATNNNVEYIYDASSIVGSESFGIKNYQQFISNDNLSNRTAFLWQQFWSGGTIGDNITSTPALLLRIKIKMINVNANPDVCFETNSPFDDQFFTSCGPYGPGLAAADCANEVGAQIFDYTPDCSGALVISGVDCTGGVTTTWTAGAWDNGIPDNTVNAVINADYVTTAVNANIDACSLQITGNGLLQIDAGDYVKVESDITVDASGILFIQNEGSLVQVDDNALVTKNGNILVTKTTTNVGVNGFSILGSPMSGSIREGVYVNQTIVRHHTTSNFSPNTEVEALDPGVILNFADDNGNDWQTHTGAITVGEGYLVTSSNPADANTPINVSYLEGTLNNGVYTYTAGFNTPGPTAGDNQNASPNMLSNPYASAIEVNSFITMNSGIVDEVYFWEHLTQNGTSTGNGGDPYPGYKTNNYDMGDISRHNGTLGVAAPNDDPLNFPTANIASGQGFAIKAKTGGAITFNNSLRRTGLNDQYRNTNSTTEKIYIAIKNETYNLGSSMAVAFTENTTNEYDNGFEAKRLGTPISIYSVLDDYELAIQGRSIFTTDQVIPLGFRTQVEEEQTYKIYVSTIEGDNITQATVYLEDNLLGTVTNLSEGSYTFTSNESNQKDRFVIVFVDEQLGNNDVSLESISLYPNPTSDFVRIISPLSSITNVAVYDLRGRMIVTNKVENRSSYQLDMSGLESAMYFVKINTENGTITERVIRE